MAGHPFFLITHTAAKEPEPVKYLREIRVQMTAASRMYGLTEMLVLPPVSSAYPSRGTAYTRNSAVVHYATRLVRTGAVGRATSYYDLKAAMPKGLRMSTAAEEYALQHALEDADMDPGTAPVFEDLFGRNDDTWYVEQPTATGLRVPKGREPTVYESDRQGNKYWLRTVLVGRKEVGELLVPEGDERVIVAWDEAFGLPRETAAIDEPHQPYTAHFRFHPTPSRDGISGKHDVAVVRVSSWLRIDEDERCLVIDARIARDGVSPYIGFRPVRGHVPRMRRA